MSSDTLDKIDEVIKKIRADDFEKVEDNVNEGTDTKIFNGTIDNVSTDYVIEEKIVKKSNVGIYISYFIFLALVVCLVILFVLFLYK